MNLSNKQLLFSVVLIVATVNVAVVSAFSLPSAQRSSMSPHPQQPLRHYRPVPTHSRQKSPPCLRQSILPLPLYSSTTPDEDSSSESAARQDDEEDESPKNKSIVQRIRGYFAPKNDNLTFRQRLAKMGLAAALSYGWVSNMSYSVTVSLAWYIFCKQTGKSPLAPGQWKGFLAVYAGFWVFNNIIRPIRLALAVAISPQFDHVVLSIQNRFRVSKAAAITITVILANLIGTTVAMSAGILLAATLAGVPIFAR